LQAQYLEVKSIKRKHHQCDKTVIVNELSIQNIYPSHATSNQQKHLPHPHMHTIWPNSLSPPLSHLISYTEPMKYGETKTGINSLEGPTLQSTNRGSKRNLLCYAMVWIFRDCSYVLTRMWTQPKSSTTTSIDVTLQKQPPVQTLRLATSLVAKEETSAGATQPTGLLRR